jgi:hypothetical protein
MGVSLPALLARKSRGGHLERRGILVWDAESSQLHLQDEDSEDALGAARINLTTTLAN